MNTTYRVSVTVDFETREEAEAAISDMEEAAAKHDGDLQIAEVEDLSLED